jgi:hypothetical protein
VAIEENGYSVPDANKTRINVTNEPSDAHKTFLKEELMEDIIKNLTEKL